MKNWYDTNHYPYSYESVKKFCPDLDNKKVGETTSVGLLIYKDDSKVEIMSEGLFEVDAKYYPMLKGEVGEEYWEGDLCKGVVLRSKDENGRFLMSYASYGFNREELL